MRIAQCRVTLLSEESSHSGASVERSRLQSVQSRVQAVQRLYCARGLLAEQRNLGQQATG